jgi:hypothetical protein
MTPANKRKHLRRTINYPAFLDFGDGTPWRECTMCDVSQEGAQLQVVDVEGVPDLFVLALRADGAARRQCRVAWRTKTQIGVEFVKPVQPKKSPRGFHAFLSGSGRAH